MFRTRSARSAKRSAAAKLLARSKAAEKPRTLKGLASRQAQFWFLRFATQNGHPELIESRFQQSGEDKQGNKLPEAHAYGEELSNGGLTLDALCIAAVKARVEIASGRGSQKLIEVQKTTNTSSYVGTLVNMLHKADKLGLALFGDNWNTSRPITTSRPEGKVICRFIWGGTDAAKKLRIFVGGDAGRDLVEITDTDALLHLAGDLEAKHPDNWQNPIIERPPTPGNYIVNRKDLARWKLVEPGTRVFFEACRKEYWPETSAAKPPTELAKAPFAIAHLKVVKWLKSGAPVSNGKPGGDQLPKLKAIAENPDSPFPLPLLYDLQLELRESGDLPAAHHGYRAFPLNRADNTSAVLQVPLFELDEEPAEGKSEADKPLKLRAFMAWLKIERVPCRVTFKRRLLCAIKRRLFQKTGQ